MNSTLRIPRLAVVLFLMGLAAFSANIAAAGWAVPRIDIGDFSRHVRSLREAQNLPSGSKIAMACRECKMRDVHDVSEKERVLSWFSPQVQHKCPGCGGRMTYKGPAVVKKGTQYTHVCSKCGNESTYICAKAPKPKSQPRS